ncbi:Saccharopine dehydrogenase-domain-containing protein [Syncephalis pseudoplumigaleata]|uniref:Saccharopine dehydrogenase-domain-containing protein n=1 Tax=Syncephalis pseudoplumigaleata TaxID=1712513 RepID=A0A4P9YUA4_9FUNG|nr:Saccharopine dehydrogenase-domain-containing protein [Syncephalis pseudoplumigaleata]|eukprot:RKP23404.1 Saccharopine dehydrogenase-domain-containing protein [Syncephalis pseudoplumigaleata]
MTNDTSDRSLFASLVNDVDDAITGRDHDDREFDLIVFGASGYMGRMICTYLAQNAPRTLKWAIAGRNSDKLVRVRNELVKIEERFKDMGVIVADMRHFNTLSTIAAKARLIINATGPYGELGIDMVKACVNEKTDYVDLSNENIFTRKIIDAFDAKARENHTMIIPACGFYSMPADLGAYVLTKHIRHKYHRETKRIKGTVQTQKEVLSRGAVHSILHAAKSFFSTLRQMLDPYYLVTGQGPRPANIRDFFLPIYYDSDFEGAQGFYLGSSGNEQVVRRTNQVKGYKYGEKFTYTESRTYTNRFTAMYYTATEVGFCSCLLFPPFRWFMRLVWPRWAGEPTQKKLEGGSWTMKFVGRVAYEKKHDKENIPKTVKAVLSDRTDPRVNGSVKLIVEAALAMIEDRHGLPGHNGGVLTPASALGTPLVERLRRVGVHIEVGEDAW